MLANRVREYTATVGTGDVALMGAMAGYARFADGFAVGESLLYVIEDGDNYEIGTGTLAASDTLTRAQVAETLVAGELVRESASPIALSGNATISCAATADYLAGLGEITDFTSDLSITHAGDPRITLTDTTAGNRATIRATNAGMEFSADSDSQASASYFEWNIDGQQVMDFAKSDVPAARLHVRGGQAVTLALGSDFNTAFGLTDAVPKSARIAVPHFLNDEEPVAVLHGYSNGTENVLNIGGGSSIMNAATKLSFYTAEDNASTTGVERFYVSAAGDFVSHGGDIVGATSADDLRISGGASGNDGGNIVLYGQDHPASAGDILLRSGTTPVLHWDDSAPIWNFCGNNLTGMKSVARGTGDALLSLSGGSNTNLGANLLLYGEQLASLAFRINTSTVLGYTDSLGVWNFGNKIVDNLSELHMSQGIVCNNANSAYLVVSGSDSAGSGGNAVFYGANHSTKANDIELRQGTAVRMHYDYSLGIFDFKNHTICGVDLLITNQVEFGQAAPVILAGSGSPEGVVEATTGSLYLSQDSGLYVKETVSTSNGWVLK